MVECLMYSALFFDTSIAVVDGLCCTEWIKSVSQSQMTPAPGHNAFLVFLRVPLTIVSA